MSGEWSFPLERDAARGTDMPDGLSLADMMAYTSLRNIYERFREHRANREQSSREKRLIIREWQKAKDAEAFDRKMNDYHVRLRKTVERASCACRKDPTPENALRLCDVIDGINLGSKSDEM